MFSLLHIRLMFVHREYTRITGCCLAWRCEYHMIGWYWRVLTILSVYPARHNTRALALACRCVSDSFRYYSVPLAVAVGAPIDIYFHFDHCVTFCYDFRLYEFFSLICTMHAHSHCLSINDRCIQIKAERTHRTRNVTHSIAIDVARRPNKTNTRFFFNAFLILALLFSAPCGFCGLCCSCGSHWFLRCKFIFTLFSKLRFDINRVFDYNIRIESFRTIGGYHRIRFRFFSSFLSFLLFTLCSRKHSHAHYAADS